MRTLRWWLEEHGARLVGDGMVPLLAYAGSLGTETCSDNAMQAVRMLHSVRAEAVRMEEPAWAVAADYFVASATWHCLGDLRRALRLASRAVTYARATGAVRSVPGLYAQEALLGAWLAADGPGCTMHVLQAARGIATRSADVTARFALLRAACLALAGDGEQARAAALAALPALGWSEAHTTGVLAASLGWIGEWEEAAAAHEAAAEAFEGLGMPVEACGARLAAAEAWLAGGWPGDALALVDGCRAALEGSINRQHRARRAAVEGQALLALAEHYEAAGHLAEALDRLDGLGWLRLEAEVSLSHLRALKGLDAAVRGPVWAEAAAAAQGRVAALRSRDLDGALAALCDGDGG